MSPRMIEVIEATERRGSGQSFDDTVRIVTQYYSRDGELLAERDPQKQNVDVMGSPGSRAALENVLSALRLIVQYHDERDTPDNVIIYGVNWDTYGAVLTVGDLRRWVEGEKA